MDVFWCLLLVLPFHGAAEVHHLAKDPSLSPPAFSTSQSLSSVYNLSPGTRSSAPVLSTVPTSTEHNKPVNGCVSFTIRYQQEQGVAWSFNNDVVATVEFGDPPKIHFFENPRKHWSFSRNGSTLTISHLTMKDAGTYTAKAAGKKTYFILHVYKKLPKPMVTCAAQNCSSHSCRYALSCAVQGSGLGNVSYSWRMEGRPQSEDPMMLVEEILLDELSPVMCLVRNPIDQRDVTITSIAGLCKDNTTHPPDTGTWKVWIITGSVAGTGVLLTVIMLIVYCKKKGGDIFNLPAPNPANIVSSWKSFCRPSKQEQGAEP